MQVAIITGASRGLGLALAKQLADRGLGARHRRTGADALAAAEAELASRTTVRAIPGDVTDPSHRRALVAAAIELGVGGIDAVVNNASYLGPSPQPELADYPLDVVRQVYEVNVFAPLALVQEALPSLRPGARIVNITSTRRSRRTRVGAATVVEGRLEQLTACSVRSTRTCGSTGSIPGDSARRCTRRRSPTRTSPTDRCPRSRSPASSSCSKATSRAAGTGRRSWCRHERGRRVARDAGYGRMRFELPPELEASVPPEARGITRDAVRLMVAYKSEDRLVHAHFSRSPPVPRSRRSRRRQHVRHARR